ncbi:MULTISPECIES: dihydropteroate synthase [Sediminibacillus]|uniref:dihydropteroate synthase n=1 Tax=Sediminibacillus TaxID=482460 RepID=UPI00040FB47B|nr:dihydropteroate synthase [Sediminibacillus terrae]
MSFILNTKVKQYNMSKQTLVMGILNVTPDSFSDGGKYSEVAAAVEQAVLMEKEGADIIDIGGESTRPGFTPVAVQDEVDRVVPVIQAVKEAVDIPISIDTYKSETAKRALEAGASILNDIWGAKRDPEMAKVAAAFDVPIVLMHNRDNTDYGDLIEDMKKDLRESITVALESGVRKENIILDPGIGFAKTSDDNLVVLRHLDQFRELGFPMLLGTSRKSMIGKVLDVPAPERDAGTGATVCYGVSKGAADIVRVHNVKMIKDMTRMMDAMMGKGDNGIG